MLFKEQCGDNPNPMKSKFEDGRFHFSTSCTTVSNPELLSSSETGVNPRTKSWKKHA
jgi:hypothetical protein